MKASSTKNIGRLRQKFNNYLRATNQWLLETPERALEQAYKAALMIKAIEDEHFGGNKISAEPTNYSENVMSYLQGELVNKLNIIKFRMVEFKVSCSFVLSSNSNFLEKLVVIDAVIARYTSKQTKALAETPNEAVIIDSKTVRFQSYLSTVNPIKVDAISDEKGVMPKSIVRTINRIKSDLDPKAEEEVVKKFRKSSTKTKTAVRFIALLIIVPFLIQQLSKQFLLIPIVDHIRSENESQIFLNSEMEEEAIQELQNFERKLKFEILLNITPQLSRAGLEERVKRKASGLTEEFRGKSVNAISNILSDMLAVIAFCFILVISQEKIIVLKSFIDDIVYGISDSAKAFIIILFTDMFVGFHSSHGWEVILEGLTEHLGIAANKNMIFLFIATFPVILDTIFKYWIFRYLSQTSPSAVATLRNMNE